MGPQYRQRKAEKKEQYANQYTNEESNNIDHIFDMKPNINSAPPAVAEFLSNQPIHITPTANPNPMDIRVDKRHEKRSNKKKINSEGWSSAQISRQDAEKINKITTQQCRHSYRFRLVPRKNRNRKPIPPQPVMEKDNM